MFNKRIAETTLTGETADRLFSNITAQNAPDQSFLATLRALCYKRLPADESIRLTVLAKNDDLSQAETASPAAYINALIPSEFRVPASSIHNIVLIYTLRQEAGEKMLETVKAHAGADKRYMRNYIGRDDLRVFYAHKLRAMFYTDTAQQNTIIFTDKLELKQFHALQMMIPQYLPRLFQDTPLSQDEIHLLKSAGEKSVGEYERLIEEFAKAMDIRSEIIRTKLAGFETAFERIRIAELKNEVSAYREDYEHYLSILRELSRKIEERTYLLAGMECAVGAQAEHSELMEYFMCNKNLSVIQVVGTAVEFVVHGYADIYDEEAFAMYVENHNGYMYARIHSSITCNQMEKLYRAIFSEGKYRLRMCAAYTADMRNGLKAFSHYEFPAESKTYLPNPHIQHYGCIGSYAGRFQEYMKHKDYIGAIDQAVVSARNLNFYDSAVIATFSHDLSCSDIRCIERSDGTLLTPPEAIKELE